MSTAFYWFVPVDGDSQSPGTVTPDFPSTNFEHLKDVTLAAEAGGFEGLLIPFSFRNLTYGHTSPYVDTWTVASALGSVTSRIRLLPAILTGDLWNPWFIARAAATLDHLTGGRVDLNIITGARSEPGLGNPVVDHDTRYDRTAEFIDSLRGLWSQETFDYSGQFFQFESMDCLPKPVQKPEVPLFFSGQSPAARTVAIEKQVHTHLFGGDTPDAISERIQGFHDEANATGRECNIRFGVRFQVLCAGTDDEAWAAAQHMMDSFDPAIVAERASYLSSRDDVRNELLTEVQRRIAEEELMNARSHSPHPNVWSGLRLVRPGASHALIGSPTTIASTIQEYVDAGVGLFILSGYPHDGMCERVARDVLPLVQKVHEVAV